MVSKTNASLYTVSALILCVTATGLVIYYCKMKQKKAALLRQINPGAQYNSEKAKEKTQQAEKYAKGRRSEGGKQFVPMPRREAAL